MKRNSTARDTRTSSPTTGVATDESSSGPDKPIRSRSIQGTLLPDSMPAPGWTDEKHSLFLKSMEASFVDQLYNSMDMLGCSSHKKNSPDQKLSTKSHVKSPSTSGQFKVLRGRCWKKVNSERSNSHINRTYECQDLLANPWIQHFRSASKHRGVTYSTLQDTATSTSRKIELSGTTGTSCALATSSKQTSLCESHMCHQDMVCNSREVSDQNFVDEVVGDDRKVKSTAKSMKTSIPDVSTTDQAVPFTGFKRRFSQESNLCY
ncbi:cold regulated protein [Quillaja saponaria]|uniref:Cold regulated protein n=1 Tax=Quillaja saponaria TaxID=32244 RepID=A0AAD7LIV9_QUISA|nr:cold regulated protein [Quillaja saponaria]